MKRLLVVGLVALAGCSLRPTYYQTLKEQATALRQGDLESAGIAFITPSTVTGQEQEKQVVALAFADVLKHQRPGLKVSSLAETLSAVNRAGLTEPYKRMYDDYRDTGLFSSDTLRRVAEATGTRYVAQLKLQGFGQGSKGRFGLLGLRIVETLYGDVRVYLQIWDSRDGSIAWEVMHELRISRDTTTEEPITMRVLLERSAQELVAKLP